MTKTEPELRRLEEYQRIFGYSPHSLIALTANTHSWISKSGVGAVVYLPVGRTWLAAEPMGKAEHLEALASEFCEFARLSKRLAAFVPVSPRFAALSKQLQLDCVPIGMSPYFDLGEWNLSGRKKHALRAGINQARRVGVTVEAVALDGSLREQLEKLCLGWNAGRRTSTFGWVFAPDPFSFPEYKTMFVARDKEGKLIGFLTVSPMPARNCAYMEDVQRAGTAPKGTTDLLFITATDHLRVQGVRFATLGTVPLYGVERGGAIYEGRHNLARRVMSAVFHRGDSIYNFAGVHRFKARMDPTFWEHEYVVAPPSLLMTPRVVFAAMRAIAGGSVIKALSSASWSHGKRVSQAE